MKEYGRRDFLKALGIGAGAAAIAKALPKQEPGLLHPGSRINIDFTSSDPNLPFEFPWEFFGETELPPYVADIEHADLITLQTAEPPEGYSFFARGMRMAIREDVTLKDMQTFMDSWRVSFRSGGSDLFIGPAFALMSGWGIGGGAGTIPIFPQIAIPPDRPIQLAVHGKPFPLSGPLVIAASIYGVGTEQGTANASPSEATQRAGGNKKA